MPLIINNNYKAVINRVQSYDMNQFDKAVATLEELSEAESDEGECVFDDYATIAKAVIETYLNQEIAVLHTTTCGMRRMQMPEPTYTCTPWRDGDKWRVSDTDGNVAYGETKEEAIMKLEEMRDGNDN